MAEEGKGSKRVGGGRVTVMLEQKHFKIKYPNVRFLSVNLQGPNKKLRLNESVTKADGEKHQKIK